MPLTVEQYHRMLETGILRDGDPYELLDGFLVRKDRSATGTDPMTIGPDHTGGVELLGELETDLQLIQLQLDVTDMVAEVHNVHHPVSGNLYYHDQMDAAYEAAQHFRDTRIPHYLDHFEGALEENGGPFMLGDSWTHVDTSLFQLMEGLDYMFTNFMHGRDYPRLELCRQAVMEIDGVEQYLASDRRLPFNQDGIFRHYPELDSE